MVWWFLPSFGANKDRCITLLQYNWCKQNQQRFEAWMAQKLAKNANACSQETMYEVPVVVHIVHSGNQIGQGNNIPRQQVLAQMPDGEVLEEAGIHIHPCHGGIPSVGVL